MIKNHEKCKPGDTGFVHYSGHGGRVKVRWGKIRLDIVLLYAQLTLTSHILDKEL